MCSRFGLDLSRDEIKSQLGLEVPEFKPGVFYPGQEVLILTDKLETKSWRLIPSWMKDAKRGPHNARIETASTKPMFRSAYKSRRCIVLCTSFFEFHEKKPVEFTSGKLIGLAGLWEGDTCTILTQEANEPISAYHDRQPLVLLPSEFEGWVKESKLDILEKVTLA